LQNPHALRPHTALDSGAEALPEGLVRVLRTKWHPLRCHGDEERHKDPIVPIDNLLCVFCMCIPYKCLYHPHNVKFYSPSCLFEVDRKFKLCMFIWVNHPNNNTNRSSRISLCSVVDDGQIRPPRPTAAPPFALYWGC